MIMGFFIVINLLSDEGRKRNIFFVILVRYLFFYNIGKNKIL